MESKLKHLEFIQNVITRMNTNSFLIKGWFITVLSALLAIYVANQNRYFLLIGIIPAILFWLLDTYYLQQERKFRGLYNDVAGVSEKPNQLKNFEMNPDLYKGGKYCYFNVLRSKTIWPLYFPLSLILLVMYIYLK